MTSQQQIALIRRIFYCLLFLAIAAGAWIYTPSNKTANKKTKAAQVAKKEQPLEIVPLKEEGGKPSEFKAAEVIVTQVPDNVTSQEFYQVLKKVVSPKNGVAIIHCHLPGDPESEQMADVFNAIEKKHGELVSVTRIAFSAQPKDWEQQKGMKLPHVMMIVGSDNVFQFQGYWPLPKVDKKVTELLIGLKRTGKDWRPPVPGMTPKAR